MNSILEDARRKITRFNEIGLHYNLMANQIYEKRFLQGVDPFDNSFLQYIIAGLISFDIGRMMGNKKYEFEANGFGMRLNSKVRKARASLEPLVNLSLVEIDLQLISDAVKEAYDTLSSTGSGALNEDERDHFYVGTTKILHFLNPKLFIIVDSNAARAFRDAHGIRFRNTTQPGYSGERYEQCMKCAQNDITAYGVEQFQSLELGLPITRIYDKLTFVTGTEL